MEIEVEIFNMNSMTREVCEKLESNVFFKEELEIVSHVNKKNGFFRMMGVEVDGLKFRISDREKFIRHIFERYFEGYNIEKPSGVDIGQPDYVLTNGKMVIYLELKIGGDTLRQSQLKWLANNKDKTNKLIFIQYDDDFSPFRDGSI